MKKLTKLLGKALVAGTLIFSGCGKKKEREIIIRNKSDEQIAYEQALDIAKNPSKYATREREISDKTYKTITGNIVAERKNLGLENFFLKGKELEYAKPSTSNTLFNEEVKKTLL